MEGARKVVSRMLTTTAALFAVATAAEADRVDDNLQRMLEAARKLEYREHPYDRAWLLEKLDTTRSPVAVVFGYADNGAACRQIAEVLSASGVAGTFECTPVN
jgi:hypothetical protein